jgi:hypothetical protein
VSTTNAKKHRRQAPMRALPVGLIASTTEVEQGVDGRAPGALSTGPATATTKVEEDVNGGPLEGRYRWVRQRPPPRLKKTSMVGPLGVLLVGPEVSTTKVEEDVDGGPPGWRCRWVRQLPPPMMKKTSMAGALAGADGYLRAPTINMATIDVGPLGPLEGPVSIHDPQVCCDLHRQYR